MRTLAIIFLLMSGSLNSQTSLFIDLNSTIKGSFSNSDFDHWKNGGENYSIFSNYFDIYMSKISFYRPINIGVSGGIKFKKNEISISIASDGSSTVEKVSFPTYQESVDFINAGTMIFKTKTSCKSLQLSYARYFNKFPNLKLFGGVNYYFRQGGKGVQKLIETGFETYVIDQTHLMDVTFLQFTNDNNRGYGFHLGFDYKLNIRKTYICNIGFTYKRDQSYLYVNQIQVITDKGNAEERKYVFSHFPTNSSINFNLSRRFKYTFKKKNTNSITNNSNH